MRSTIAALLALLVGLGVAVAQEADETAPKPMKEATNAKDTDDPPPAKEKAKEKAEPKQKTDATKKTEPRTATADQATPSLRVADVVGNLPPLPGPVTPEEELLPSESLFALSADSLLWRIRRIPVSVPLVSNRALTGQSVGPTDFNPSTFLGLGLGARLWFGPERRFGLEGSGQIFEQRSHYFGISSTADGTPQLDRPFLSAATGESIQLPISVPGFLTGRF